MLGESISNLFSHEDQLGELFQAAEAGNTAEVTRLLKIDAVRNAAHSGSSHALWLAAHNGHPEIVAQLIQIPAVKNNAHALDNHALRAAVFKNDVATVKQLLAIPAVRDNAHVLNNFILRIATTHGHIEITGLLLSIETVRLEFIQDTNHQKQIIDKILYSLLEKNPIITINQEEQLKQIPTYTENYIARLVYGLVYERLLCPDLVTPEQKNFLEHHINYLPPQTPLLLALLGGNPTTSIYSWNIAREDFSLATLNASNSTFTPAADGMLNNFSTHTAPVEEEPSNQERKRSSILICN